MKHTQKQETLFNYVPHFEVIMSKTDQPESKKIKKIKKSEVKKNSKTAW